MYNVDTNQRIQRGPLPVSDNTIVTWLGFSEYGVPAFYDDTGVVHILNHYRRIDQGQWVPILDTSVLDSDKDTPPTYWPVGLSDEVFTCVKCRVSANAYCEYAAKLLYQPLLCIIFIWNSCFLVI